MALATHLIKIKGTFDERMWTIEKIKKLIQKKIKEEIMDIYHAEVEKFRVSENTVEVWVLVSALPSEVTNEIIDKWLSDHMKERGIEIKKFSVDEIAKWERHRGFAIFLDSKK